MYCSCVHTDTQKPEANISYVSHLFSTSVTLRQVFSLNLKLTARLDWLAANSRDLPVSSLLPHPTWGTQIHATACCFDMGIRAANSGPQACMATTSWTKNLPNFSIHFMKKKMNSNNNKRLNLGLEMGFKTSLSGGSHYA